MTRSNGLTMSRQQLIDSTFLMLLSNQEKGLLFEIVENQELMGRLIFCIDILKFPVD